MADEKNVNAAEYRKQIDVVYTNALIDLQENSPDSAEYKKALDSALEYGLLYTSGGKCASKDDLAANEMILASPEFRASSLKETAFLRITKEPASSKLVSFGEALDFFGVERPKMPEEPKRPRRGFFGTIRDLLFGKNNAGRHEYDNKVAAYNRQMRRYEEVCDAKIKNVLETKLGMNVPEYDKVLVNDELANEYVKNNVSLDAAREAQAKNAEFEHRMDEASKALGDYFKEVSAQRGRADEKLGAQLILNYLKNIKENPSLETPESMVLTKFLMSNGSKKEEVETLCYKVGADVVFDDESIDVITKSIENVVNASLNPKTGDLLRDAGEAEHAPDPIDPQIENLEKTNESAPEQNQSSAENEKGNDNLKIEDDTQLKADGPELILRNEPKPEEEKKQPETEANEPEEKEPETVVNSRVDYVWSESGEIRNPYRRDAEEIRNTTSVMAEDDDVETLRIDEESANVVGQHSADAQKSTLNKWENALNKELAARYKVLKGSDEFAIQDAVNSGRHVDVLGSVRIFTDETFETPIEFRDAYDMLKSGKLLYASAGTQENGYSFRVNKSGDLEVGNKIGIKTSRLNHALTKELSEALNKNVEKIAVYADKERNTYTSLNSIMDGLTKGSTYYVGESGSDRVFRFGYDIKGLVFGDQIDDAIDKLKQSLDDKLTSALNPKVKDGEPVKKITDIRIYADAKRTRPLTFDKAYDMLRPFGKTLYVSAEGSDKVFDFSVDKNGSLFFGNEISELSKDAGRVKEAGKSTNGIGIASYVIDNIEELSRISKGTPWERKKTDVLPKKVYTLLKSKDFQLSGLSKSESKYVKKSIGEWLGGNRYSIANVFEKNLRSDSKELAAVKDYIHRELNAETIYSVLQEKQTQRSMDRRAQAISDSRSKIKFAKETAKSAYMQVEINKIRAEAYRNIADVKATPEQVTDEIAKIMVCHIFSAKNTPEMDAIRRAGKDPAIAAKLDEGNAQSIIAREKMAKDPKVFENAVNQIKNTPAFKYCKNEYLENPNKSTFFGTQRGILEVRGLMEQHPIGAVEGLKAQSVAAEAMLIKNFNEKNVSLSNGKKDAEATMDKILSASNESENLINVK